VLSVTGSGHHGKSFRVELSRRKATCTFERAPASLRLVCAVALHRQARSCWALAPMLGRHSSGSGRRHLSSLTLAQSNTIRSTQRRGNAGTARWRKYRCKRSIGIPSYCQYSILAEMSAQLLMVDNKQLLDLVSHHHCHGLLQLPPFAWRAMTYQPTRSLPECSGTTRPS
jgi:hypothetical protein